MELACLEHLLQSQNILRGLEAVLKGEFNRDLIAPYHLVTILQRINSALPVGLSLLTGADLEGARVYFDVSRVQVVSTSDGLVVLLDLPLRSAEQQMTLYEVVSRPILEATSKRLVIARPEGAYFLVGGNTSSYTFLQPHLLQECRRGRVSVCPALVPIYGRKTPSCILGHFLWLEEMIREQCQWELALQSKTSMWIWDHYQEQWHYSLSNRTRVQVLCRDVGALQAEEQELQGSGSLRVPEGCTIWTPQYRLWPMAEDGSLREERNWTWLHVRLTEPYQLTTPSDTDASDLQDALLALDQLRGTATTGDRWVPWLDVVERLEAAKRERSTQAVWIAAVWTLFGTIGVAAALGGLLLAIRRRRDTLARNQGCSQGEGTREELDGSAAAGTSDCRIRYPGGWISSPKVAFWRESPL